MIVKRLIGKVSIDDRECNVNGTLSIEQSLTGQINQRMGLTGRLAAVYATHVEAYNGSYEVTPKTFSQTLETKEKYMNNNVSIRSIPYFDVGNTSGGSTVYIGTEIEIE